MAQLNDLLVMGQSTLLGPIRGTYLTIDGSVAVQVGRSNECNFTSLTNSTTLYVNYSGGMNTVRICDGNTGLGTLIVNQINASKIADSGGATGSSGQVLTVQPNGNIGWGTVASSNSTVNNYYTDYPTGFDGRNTGAEWGQIKTTGHSLITDWNLKTGGDIAFVSHNDGTQISLQVDGYFYQNEGNYRVMDISGGTFTGQITAPSFNAQSDRRLKEHLLSYTPKKSILDLPIYKFDFINGDKNQIGCMAQDLKEICPEIVSENDNGYLSIQESKIIYLLIDEVKKLKEKINCFEESVVLHNGR